MKPITIAVVGAGYAGPVAACLLARQGHKVTLFDKASKMLPVGAGFMLQPSGMEVLQELGCLDKVLQVTQRLDTLYCKTAKGKTLLDLSYEEVQPGLFGAGTQRAAFLEVLMQQCAEETVDVRWGSPIDSVQLVADKRVLSSSGSPQGAFDLVIVADGANSQLRTQLDIPQKLSVYPWGALWFIGIRTKEFAHNKLWQVVDGTHILNGFLPTGTQKDLLSMFYSFRLGDEDTFHKTPLKLWKGKLLKSTPEAESFLEQIQSHDQLKIAKYHDVIMPRWHCDRAAILGDAAHALSPQLGQGVNLALQDAQCLAKSIEIHNNLNEALVSYSSLRKKQIKFYQFATRSLTPFFQSDLDILAKLRDFSFPIATKSKWIRRQMTLSMAGYKDGIISS